jgi:hypothetical protein
MPDRTLFSAELAPLALKKQKSQAGSTTSTRKSHFISWLPLKITKIGAEGRLIR